MKILDRYILTTYLKTFLSVFTILVLIFVLQTIWLYIRELSGKDLDIGVIIKFLLYFMPKLIPLVLPLTILLASIMVFGSFAENYEFAAMKSTGISLQRAMSGLSVFIVILGFTTFLFSNNIIPWAEYNSLNLRKNIAKIKPSMAIAEGQFNAIDDQGNFNIKVDKKSGENGRLLETITIHKKGAYKNANAIVIKAKTGELISDEKSDILKLVLYDGYYYQARRLKKPADRKKHPFAKGPFKKYTMNIDLSQLSSDVDIDKKSKINKSTMLNMSELNYTIDSLNIKRQREHEDFSKSMYQRTSVFKKKAVNDQVKTETDSVYLGQILDLFNAKSKSQLVDIASKFSITTRQTITSKKGFIKNSKSNFNKHVISFHEKLALGFACVILFFVGAPLGALIRKGGLGLPMIVAILLFLTYHFIGLFAKNSAEKGAMDPILGAWFSTLIMFPLSVFLTKRATADRGLFEFGSISEPLKKIFNIKEKDSVDYKFLSSNTTEELISVINNYETLGHHESARYEAIKVLKRRGFSIKNLRDEGLVVDKNYETSETITKDFKEHSKFAIVLYSIGVILLVLHFVFKNNKLPSLELASIQLSLVGFILFLVYYLKSFINITSFYKHINKKNKAPSIILIILGTPIYMITHLFLKAKIKEDLKQNCLDSLK